MDSVQTVRFVTADGLWGVIEASDKSLEGGLEYVHGRMDDGRDVIIPVDKLRRQVDGTYMLTEDLSGDMVDEVGEQDKDTVRIPVIEETLDVQKRPVKKGIVHIKKRVHQHEETVKEPGYVEEVEVVHVPVNRPLERPVETHQEGETTIIPLMEEVLVVEKRLVLREEVRITKRRRLVHNPQQITLRREEVLVDRTEDEVERKVDQGAADISA